MCLVEARDVFCDLIQDKNLFIQLKKVSTPKLSKVTHFLPFFTKKIAKLYHKNLENSY